MKDEQTAETILNFFVTYAPVIKSLFSEDVDVTIVNKEIVLEQLLSKELTAESSKGRKMTADEPIMDVMRRNKILTTYIPKEYYGCPFNATMVPIQDAAGHVIGGIAISRSTLKQEQLTAVAAQFATSSEEISASTEQLATAAHQVDRSMTHLAEAQLEMQQQVESTRKMLDMINAVAKNTRILGFNAGIEAARSGEHGRGFSVVAKEITKLADQSAESVQEIRQLILQLTSKVDEVANIVKQSATNTANQTVAIEDIANSVQQLTDVADTIEAMAKQL